MKPFGLCLSAALTLAACNVTTEGERTSFVQAAQSLGNWQMRQEVARISGRNVDIAQLKSISARQQSRKKSYLAQISVFCEADGPAVHITFEGSVSSRVKADFGYRADSNQGQVLKAGTSSDRKSVVLRRDEHASEFLRQLGPSSVLHVRIDSPGTGISEAEFATAGAATAIEAALRDCPFREREVRERDGKA